MKKLTMAGCILWIVGLVVFIVGMNLTGETKELMKVIGSAVFILGLGITGVVWVKQKSDSEK